MIKYLSILAAVIIGLGGPGGNSSRAEDNIWSTSGPEGARVHVITLNPFDSNRLLIGTIEDGIYGSSDRGDSWAPLRNDSLDRTIRDIVFNPHSPDTLYAATLRGMGKSVDGGQTWFRMGPAQYWYSECLDLEIHPQQTNLLFAGYGIFGVPGGYRSTDGGATWDTLNLPWVAVAAIKADPINLDRIYYASQSPRWRLSVFRSDNFGVDWYSIHNDLDTNCIGQDLEIDPINPEIIYFGGIDFNNITGVCLEKTTDAGRHWFDISPPGLTVPSIFDIEISPLDHQKIYICTMRDGVLKSADGGQTWQAINNGLHERWMRRITCDPVSGYLYLGIFRQDLFRSTDDGASWQKICANLYNANCWQICVNPQDADSAYATGPGGFYRTTDGGQSWQDINLSFPFEESGQYGVLIDPLVPADIYVAYYQDQLLEQGGVCRSTDGGENWQFFSSGLPANEFLSVLKISVHSYSDKRLLLATRGVYVSDDRGETWTPSSEGLPPDQIFFRMAVSPLDPDLIAVSDLRNGLYLSTDRALSWQSLPGPPGSGVIYDLAFDPQNRESLLATREYMGIFRTTDLGTNWQDINSNLPQHPTYYIASGIAVNPYNNQNLYVNSLYNGIFVTYDGGQSWQDFNVGLKTFYAWAATALAPSDTNRLYLATDMQSVWSIHRTATGVEEEPLPLPERLSLSAYPNPFNNQTTLTVRGAAQALIGIYDITGRKVGSLQAHEGQAVWDARGLSSGLYFARVESAGTSPILKLILLK